MLDPERNLNTTYRISVWPDGLYEVVTYPKAPEKIVSSAYRFDLLPQWIQETVSMLNWAHPEGVEGLGRKVGDDTYWVEAVDYTDAVALWTTHEKALTRMREVVTSPSR